MSIRLDVLNMARTDAIYRWCKPCHMLSPILEKLTDDPDIQSGSGKPLDLVTIDTESQDGLTMSSKFGVRSSFLLTRSAISYESFLGTCYADSDSVPRWEGGRPLCGGLDRA